MTTKKAATTTKTAVKKSATAKKVVAPIEEVTQVENVEKFKMPEDIGAPVIQVTDNDGNVTNYPQENTAESIIQGQVEEVSQVDETQSGEAEPTPFENTVVEGSPAPSVEEINNLMQPINHLEVVQNIINNPVHNNSIHELAKALRDFELDTIRIINAIDQYYKNHTHDLKEDDGKKILVAKKF